MPRVSCKSEVMVFQEAASSQMKTKRKLASNCMALTHTHISSMHSCTHCHLYLYLEVCSKWLATFWYIFLASPRYPHPRTAPRTSDSVLCCSLAKDAKTSKLNNMSIEPQSSLVDCQMPSTTLSVTDLLIMLICISLCYDFELHNT